MIIVLKNGFSKIEIDSFINYLESKYEIKITQFTNNGLNVLGIDGDITSIDTDLISKQEIIESIKLIQNPYKKASRELHPQNTIINIDNKKIGSNDITLIAGPCAVESLEQICNIAKDVKEAGAEFLRGGAFKPRTSPYDFQGLRKQGIKFLLEAKKITNIPIVTELTDIRNLHLFEGVDIIQVGARNMQNFELLKELGKTQKPILLKRGLCNTIRELLMSAEYIISAGNSNVILCERGIRTYETFTRNTLDISAVAVLKKVSHLPIIVDPSHAGGIDWLIEPLSIAAVAAGADGLIIEVHNNPPKALSDSQQSITPEKFKHIYSRVKSLSNFLKNEKIT